MKNRLEYVDTFRGIALLIMVLIQIFDYLARSSIYRTTPYYVGAINSVTWVPPSLLFTFVSGMSVLLLVRKRLLTMPKFAILIEVVKRYGIYILISLPFTSFMWDFQTYFRWDEAIQGLGFTAIFAAIVLLLWLNSKHLKWIILPSIFILAGIQHYALHVVRIGTWNIPGLNLILNIFFRGWFSVINLLPIMLAGIIFVQLAESKRIKTLCVYCIGFIILSVLLHAYVMPIDYYSRSFSLTSFAVAECSLICLLAYAAYAHIKKIKLADILSVFGQAAFFVYIAHYILILKVLDMSGFANRLPDLYAWLITVPLVVGVYFLAKFYLANYKGRLFVS